MRLAVAAVAMLTVRALAAPLSTGSASYHRHRTACLIVERVVDASSQTRLVPNTLGAHDDLSSHESEAASTTKRSISELAAMMAISMGADKPGEFLRRLSIDAGLNPRARSAERKREAAPRPWCFRRGWMCWKRDLSRVDSAAEADKARRGTCWHPWNLLWMAKQMVDAVLRALGPNGEGTKPVTTKHEAECRHLEDLYGTTKQDFDTIQALKRRALPSSE